MADSQKVEIQKLDEAMSAAINPDMETWEKFKVGDREFQIKPLVMKWDKIWRKYALPILGAELRPFEVLLSAIVGNRAEFTVDDIGFTRAVVDSEIEADTYLAKAVAAICASQDEESSKATDKAKQVELWADRLESQMSRAELDAVLKKQSAIQKDIDQLGNSLSARFRIISSLAGNRIDLSSLLLGGKIPAAKSAETDGTTA